MIRYQQSWGGAGARLAFVLGCALLPFAGLQALAGPPRPIALTGTDGAYGPGLGSGISFTTFSTTDQLAASPALNSQGKAAFLGRLEGTGISSINDTGIWVQSGNTLRLAARAGDSAPDTGPGVAFSGFYEEPLIDAQGRTAFKAIIVGPGVNNSNNDGLWSEGFGTMRVVIRENVTPVPGGGGFFADPGPGSPTPTIWQFPMVMNAGKIAQRVRITPGLAPFNLFGIWTDRSGSLGSFIRADQQPVPGNPGWFFFVAAHQTINASGAMIALGVRSNPNSSGDRWGAWSDRSGTLVKIVEVGDLVPGLPGAAWHSIINTSINAQGRVALLAEIDGLASLPVTAIFSDARFGVLQLLARFNSIAPGAGPAAFGNLTMPVISNNGITAFYGRLLTDPPVVTEATAKGIWSNRLSGAGGGAGVLRLMVRAGDPAAGLPGVTYGDFYALAINARGDISFVAALSDGIGLFRQNAATGIIELVVRDFEPFDVFGDGSDLRLVVGLTAPQVFGNPYSSAGTGDGRRVYFNDAGDLAFRLSFADGSEGIFNTSERPCTAVSISQQPAPATTCPGASASFAVAATGVGTLTYQWRRNGTNLANGPGISGATSATLSLTNVQVASGGNYDSIVTSACGSVTSNQATLTIVSCSCALADIASDSLDTIRNPNGAIGPEDLDAFIAGFIADNASIADVASDSLDTTYNPNNSVGPEDLDAFIANFIAGC